MARHTLPRTVQCYHCRHRFEVGGRTQSTSCPSCNKAVMVADLVVSGGKMVGPLREHRTCGKIIVKKRGRLNSQFLEAHGGIECEGNIDAGEVISGGPVWIGKKGSYKGDLRAPSLIIESGAKIGLSLVNVPEDPLELADLKQVQQE